MLIALYKEILLILRSEKLFFYYDLNLFNIRGKLRNPIFRFFKIALYKEMYLILRSEKIVFIIKGLILLVGFLNNQYHPNTKNYLPCLLLGEGGGAFSIRRKGL